jgi:O-6-methylguanine DNA methyltransferase
VIRRGEELILGSFAGYRSTIYRHRFETAIGWITAYYIDETLIRLDMPFTENDAGRWFKRWIGMHDIAVPSESFSGFAAEIEREIDRYLNKMSTVIELPYKALGTPFQMIVWERLRSIPYGEVRSYKDIAFSIGHEKAYRAVGSANRSNPLPLIIPCHRVVGSDSTLGGYCGAKGIAIKRHLLNLEGCSGVL